MFEFQVIYPVCSVFVAALTICVLARISYFKSRESYGDRRFSIAGPKLWNSIPASLRNADSLNSFKKHLKTYLFHRAFFKFINRFLLNFHTYIYTYIYVVVRYFRVLIHCTAPRQYTWAFAVPCIHQRSSLLSNLQFRFVC